MSSSSRKPKPPRKRKSISASFRYELLVAADFKCQACGKSYKDERLEVDHKVPFSQGGECTPDNFEVLCLTCNRGKGARFKKDEQGRVSRVTKVKPKAPLNKEKGKQPAKKAKAKPAPPVPKRAKTKRKGKKLNLIKVVVGRFLLRLWRFYQSYLALSTTC